MVCQAFCDPDLSGNNIKWQLLPWKLISGLWPGQIPSRGQNLGPPGDVPFQLPGSDGLHILILMLVVLITTCT
jgi:hypothetical protein